MKMFKLDIVNFKCFTHKKLEIPSSQVVLLNGASGIGKTTILEALSFVLHDSNNFAPLSKVNITTSVELRLPNGLTLFRQKRPNLLKLIYTDIDPSKSLYLLDNAAQEYIFKLFGTESYWRIGAYLEQGSLCSFFNLTSNEKMNFLRELTLNNNFEKIMNRIDTNIQNLVTQYRTERNTFESYKLYYMQLYSENSAKLAGVEKWTAAIYEEFAKRYNSPIVDLPSFTSFVNTYFLSEMEKIRKEILKYNEERTKYTLIENQRRELQQKLVSRSILSEVEFEKLQGVQNSLKMAIVEKRHSISRAILLSKERELLKNIDSCSTTQEILQELAKVGRTTGEGVKFTCANDLREFETVLSKISREDLASKLSQIEKELYYHEYTRYIKIRDEFEKRNEARSSHFFTKQQRYYALAYLTPNLNENILNYKQRLALISNCQKLKCPKCDVHVYLKSNTLVAGEENESLTSLQERLAQLEELAILLTIPEIFNSNEKFSFVSTEMKHDSQLYEEAKRDYLKYDKTQYTKEPEVKTPQSSYTDCQLVYGYLKSLQQEYAKVPIEITLDVIQKWKLEFQRREKKLQYEAEYEKVKLELAKFASSEESLATEAEIQNLSTQESAIEKQIADEICNRSEIALYNQTLAALPVIDGDFLLTTILNLNKQYEELASMYNTLSRNIQEQKMLKKMTEIYDVMSTTQTKYLAIEKEEQCLQKIKPLIITAEYVLLDQVLIKINLSITEILNLLFDSPIIVELKSLRQLKTDSRIKPEINIEIIYNGIEFNSLNKLSGGEQARISLAVLIAFSKFGKVPFIIVDESLSCLDNISKERAINVIKQHLGNKTCIAINHDTKESDYDAVINL